LDLAGLMEDDNSMDLLVCNKIIKLNLAVSLVFEQVWLTENSVPEGKTPPPMEVIYRLQG
jgi:E3 ubiquitin-protein ligase UBR4